MLELNKIYNEDCIIGMKKLLKDGYKNTFDFIEIDPPYNIGKDKWDKFKNHQTYLNFINEVISLSNELMSDNGTLFLWHNNIEVLSDFIKLINTTDLKLMQLCIWNKYYKYNDDGNLNNQYGFLNGFIQSDLNRNYQKMCEYILYYTKQNEELTEYNEKDPFKSLKEYFFNAQKSSGLSRNKINQILGHRQSEHTFYTKTQWTFPTEETYLELQNIMNLPIPYNDLKNTYETMRYTYNSEKNNYRSCIWNYPISKESKHKSEKPLQLYYDLYEIHTKNNSKCLFPFVGSGNNILSLFKINNFDGGKREFVGFETDETWFTYINEKIDLRIP